MTYSLESLPKDERTAFTNIVEADEETRQEALEEYLLLRMKKRTKARRDADTDHARRTLIGVRLPRAQVERIRRAASLEGKSLYRFVADALDEASDYL